MKILAQREAEIDLETAFDYYQRRRAGLGLEFLEEYRRGLECVLQNPEAWQKLARGRRRYRLQRFPYGLVYRIEPDAEQIIITAVAHLSRRPT